MSCKINEITGDLFTAPKDTSMAHCVAEDLGMGKGIAIKFKSLFGQVQQLKAQNVSTGGVAVLNDKDQRFIYYLITKKMSYQKPTYECLYSSLQAMRNHMNSNSVKKLAIPRIGCGLDGLVWNKVLDLIREIFVDDDVEITVFNYSANSN